MRNLADLASLAYLLLYVALIGMQWVFGFSWWLYAPLLFVTIPLQIVHHNHVHLDIWRRKRWNRITDYVISVLTAVPSAMMLAGHVKNHHVHTHGPNDITRTYRFGGDHNHAVGYLLHPFQAFATLMPVFWKQFREGWPKRTRFSQDLLYQLVCVFAAWAVLLAIDWQLFVLLVLTPQLFGLHWLLGANYLQHAHCDDQSPTHYARNFIGPINWLWLNIGLHTAHHDHPTAHWSSLRALHNRHYQRLDGEVVERSFPAYIVRGLVLGPLVPQLRSRSLRSEPPASATSSVDSSPELSESMADSL